MTHNCLAILAVQSEYVLTKTREDTNLTRTDAYNKIATAAETAGFTPRIEPNSIWFRDETQTTNIIVLEHAHFNREDNKVTSADVTFELRASIATMGGNPTLDELIASADRIRAAAELVKRLEAMGLAYREELGA